VSHRGLAVLLLGAIYILAVPPAEAEVRRLVEVTYDRSRSYDRSDPQIMEVTFETGRELNKKTRSFDYQPFSNYALIWFDQDEVAIIEIDSFIVGMGAEFTHETFKNAFRLGLDVDGTQVNSRSPRKWHFVGKKFGKWIDARMRDH
jgi:hypothetical protein